MGKLIEQLQNAIKAREKASFIFNYQTAAKTISPTGPKHLRVCGEYIYIYLSNEKDEGGFG